MMNVILVIVVIIIIFWIFDSINEKFEDIIDEDVGIDVQPVVRPIIKKQHEAPFRENTVAEQYLLEKQMSEEGSKICPKPTQTPDEFNKSFFGFIDKIYNNSSMYYDSVDKVNDMKLDGEYDYRNMKIKDIYNNLTTNTNLYTKQDVRYPYFDNTMHDNYNYEFISGMHNVQDTWQYRDDNEMNTGKLEPNFFAHDEEANIHMPAFK